MVGAVVRVSSEVSCENSLDEHEPSIGEHQGHSFFHRRLANTIDVIHVRVLQRVQKTTQSKDCDLYLKNTTLDFGVIRSL